MQTFRSLLYVLLIVATIAVAFGAGFVTHGLLSGNLQPLGAILGPSPSSGDAADGFGVFWEAWHILEKSFYGPQPSVTDRTYGALRGMVQTYNDPYTVFVEPQPRQREREDLKGEFGGIGAYISQDDQGNFRLKPMADLAAEKAGIRDGDILRAVDGSPVAPTMTVDDVVAKIRGPIGTDVRLEVFRESTGETLTFVVTRQRVETPSVEWRMVENAPGVGLVAIRMFSERTPSELDRALRELSAQGATRLILDLRHNPGGLLQSAVEVASRFLPDGVVLYERKSDGSETVYRVTGGVRAVDWPMTVLVDGATASAAEIVAGALQDRGRAALVGEKTFGKGSVQFVHDLSDGSSIHVTVAHWLTPNGHEINAVGLTPDYAVATAEGRDAPLEEALRVLSGQALPFRP
ncbi:MAG: S41 family peptidase [Caldilineales bacterium]|nr:S41 family peptidase [Caldilineales bacterium]MDW8318209.1 S41 family peptidase [Anaerolineae bacterium]